MRVHYVKPSICLASVFWLPPKKGKTATSLNLLLLFSSTFSECKLSRSGPPATIVAIDEESPNGKVLGCFSFFIPVQTVGLSRARFTVTPTNPLV